MLFRSRYVETLPEVEYIDFSEFLDSEDGEKINSIKLRFVTSDAEGAEIEPPVSIMEDIPYEIRQRLECCAELYSIA